MDDSQIQEELDQIRIEELEGALRCAIECATRRGHMLDAARRDYISRRGSVCKTPYDVTDTVDLVRAAAVLGRIDGPGQ